MDFTMNQLARISGISRQMLMDWNRAGLLRAEKRMNGRVQQAVYTRAQAIGTIALAELRRLGVSQRSIRAAAGALPTAVAEDGWLAFDGQMLYSLPCAEEVASLLDAKQVIARVMRVARLTERLS